MLVTKGGWDDKDVDEAFETMQMAGTSMPHMLQKMDDAAKEKDATAVSLSVHSEIQPLQETKQPVQPSGKPQVAFNSFLTGRSAPKVMELNSNLSAESETRASLSATVDASAPSSVPASFGVDLTPEPKPVPPPSFMNPRTSSVYAPEPKPLTTGMSSDVLRSDPAPFMEPAPQPAIDSFVSVEPSPTPVWQMRQEIKPEPPLVAPSPAPPINIIRPALNVNNGQSKIEAPAFKPNFDLDAAPKSDRSAPILPPRQVPPRVVDPNNQTRAKILSFVEPQERSDSVIMPKSKPRVLFGIIMLLLGLVIGSVLMHAYLSGYFDALLRR